MGTRVDRFVAGLPVRDVNSATAVDEINNQRPPTSTDTRFFFGRNHPETARVGFGAGTASTQGAALTALHRQLRLARQIAPAPEETREAVRQRIEEQRQRFQHEQEEALKRQGRPPVQRRPGSLFKREEDEHVVRELRPAGLPAEGPRLEVPAPAYESPQVPSRNGSHLDISA